MNPLFAIIDIETTGGSPKLDKITEIAIVIHNGSQIVEQYSTLINPERSIPWHITRITGIDDEMVQDAPKFYEVAKRVVEMTEKTIFVAHNVRFDYGFIREEFSKLGFSYSKQQLCTVRLSRQAFPGLASYSLGNLIQAFQIPVINRHRALDDALATSKLFEYIMTQQGHEKVQHQILNQSIRESRYPKDLNQEKIDALSDGCGVYYMYSRSGELIYIGKSIHIKQRIKEHFTDQTSKAAKLQSMVADIQVEITGSELISIIKEDIEIRKLKPEINKAQRSHKFPFAIAVNRSNPEFPKLEITEITAKSKLKPELLCHFATLSKAQNRLRSIYRKFEICPCLQDSGERKEACLQRKFGICLSTLESISPEIMETAISQLRKTFEGSFYIIETGRNEEELGVITIQEGRLSAYGYIGIESMDGLDWMQYDTFQIQNPSGELEKIVAYYLDKFAYRIKMIPIGTISSSEDVDPFEFE
ncbi:MAG: exonuclease domain-containing protein [Saprospiraceae bacterium]